MKLKWLAAGAAALSMMASGVGAAMAMETAPRTLFKDVRLFDGLKTIARADVLIEGGKIASISGPGRSRVSGASVIDGRGKTLLPGLIDSHVHVFPSAAADALRFGVTTEADMFTLAGKEGMAAFKTQRQSYDRTAQADVWSAGAGVTTPRGHPTQLAPPGMVPSLANDADAKAFVEARIAEGSDHIKIFYDDGSTYGPTGPKFQTFTPGQLKAVIDAAHAAGKLAIVHVAEMDKARIAFEAGADGLAHIFGDRPADAAFVALAKTHGAFVIPTLSVEAGASGVEQGSLSLNDPEVRPYLSPVQVGTLSGNFKRAQPEVIVNARASVKALHDGGVPILAGTDSPNPGTGHGVSLAGEVKLLVEAGLTPTEALVAATSAPARVFGMNDRGRISPGLRADLLLVEGDPTADPAALKRIAGIWKNGYPVDRTAPKVDPRGPELAGKPAEK